MPGFSLEIKKLYWIDKSADNPQDLCLHGDVVVVIGDEHFKDSCAISAGALYLLKSLKDNRNMHEDRNRGNQMLPCCGHFWIPDEENDTVENLGCDNGIDWSVIHEKSWIRLITESKTTVTVPREEYKKIVFDFADEVKRFYDGCSPKVLPEDEFTQKGYAIFWREWARLRSL